MHAGRRRTPEPERSRPPTRGVHRDPRRGQEGRRLPGGAEPDPARDERDHLGRARLPGPARRAVEVRAPAGAQHDEAARGPHPGRPRAGRAGQDRGRAELREYQRQLADARNEAGSHHRGGAPVRRRGEAPDPAPRPRRTRPRSVPGPRRTSGSRPSAPPPTCRAGSPSCRSSWPRRSSSATSTATRSWRWSTATSRGREREREPVAGMAEATASRPTPRRCSRSRGPRGSARRGRGRPVPLRPRARGQRRAAHGARRPHAARRAAHGDRRGADGRYGAVPASVGLVSIVVGADRAGDLPAIVDRFVELAAEERKHEVAEVRARRAARRRAA